METRNREVLFTGLVVNLEQMEVRIGEKGWHVYQIVRHPGGVGVLPLHDDGTVTLIRQCDPPWADTSSRSPRGDSTPGKSPRHADVGS